MKMKITRKGLKVKKENLELPLFDLTIIADATSNFSSEHKIGEGGFGPVYKVKNRIFQSRGYCICYATYI